jgi:hypothetical protein
MSSFISSFKTEWKVLLVVLVVMGGAELRELWVNAHRPYESKLLREFPAMADRLAAQKGTRVVLLGNSLTQVGYNMPLLQSQMQANGNAEMNILNISQTGSAPAEWYHNFARLFVRRGDAPDVVVINMSPDGIADAVPMGYRIGWLAHETDWQDLPEVLGKDLGEVEVDGQYLMACVSPLYADRWDVRFETLWRITPDIKAGMAWVNSAQLTVARSKHAAAPKPPTHSLLLRMLALAKTNHTRVILVAMPARERYEIDPALPGILKFDDNAVLMDCRSIPGLNAADFSDGWHLNAQGAEMFTAYMAKELPEVVKQITRLQALKPHGS